VRRFHSLEDCAKGLHSPFSVLKISHEGHPESPLHTGLTVRCLRAHQVQTCLRKP
jgi:hypothetical protein